MLLSRYVEHFTALRFTSRRIAVPRVFVLRYNTPSLAQQPLEVNKYDHWFQDDVEILIKARERGLTIREIQAQHFPRRTYESVHRKCSTVCPATRPTWSGEDTLKLIARRKQGDSFDKIQAEHFPHRTVQACRMKHRGTKDSATISVQASRRRPRQPLTAHDDEQIISLRDQGKTAYEIRDILYPASSTDRVRRRLSKLYADEHSGISRIRTISPWSAEEKLRLQDLHVRSRLTIPEISLILKRGDNTTRITLESMGYKAHRARVNAKPWSEEDLEQLVPKQGQALSHDQCDALARRLGRSVSSILSMFHKLRKINKQSSGPRKTWTTNEVLDLDKMYAEALPWETIAAKLNCSEQAAKCKLIQLNRRRPSSERPKRIRSP